MNTSIPNNTTPITNIDLYRFPNKLVALLLIKTCIKSS